MEVDSKGVNKQEDGTFTDEKGNKVTQGEDGKYYKPIDDSKIKTKSMGPVGKSWNWMGSDGQTMKESVESFKTKKTSEKTSNPSDDNPGDKQDKPSGDNATQDTPPKQDQTGKNPSHTDNSTTGSDAKQPLSNADHARSELKLMAAEKQASLNARLDAGEISPEEFKKQSAALGTLRANIDGGHAIGVSSLKGAGFGVKDLEKAGHLHLTVSDRGTRPAVEPRSTARASSGEEHLFLVEGRDIE